MEEIVTVYLPRGKVRALVACLAHAAFIEARDYHDEESAKELAALAVCFKEAAS